MSRLLYLYGFVPAGAATPPAGLTGVGEAGVRRVDLGDVEAVVADVPAAEFSAAAVEARVHDLAWVGDQGALHERVVTWFVDHGGIVPARMLTLYSGEASLLDAVRQRTVGIQGELERLRGQREWDLKVSYRAEELRRGLGTVSETIANLDRDIASADPGRRYLLERKRDKLLDGETGRAARSLGEEALGALVPHAREVRRVAAPSDREDLPVVLHAALLVEEAREGALQRAAADEGRRLGARGITLALSGPWAPYRFVGQAEGEPADG